MIWLYIYIKVELKTENKYCTCNIIRSENWKYMYKGELKKNKILSST